MLTTKHPMADQAGDPRISMKDGNKCIEAQEMKSEAACQTTDNNGYNGTYNDSSMVDAFASLTEMKMSLHKVEAQNRKLRESRSLMQSQLEATEKHSLVCKEKLHKTTEQLSCVFQENCRLNEENARLRIDNQNLTKQLQHHKKKVEQLELLTVKLPLDFCDSCPKRKGATVSPVGANLDLHPELSRSMPETLKDSGSTPINSPAVKKLKGLEKRHSSPQFFPNNESVEEISEKLLAQLMQEKRELEQQYNQMVEIQRVSDAHTSGTLISDFSVLEPECPEEEEELIQQVEKCSNHLFDVKKDIVFMNYTLKYLLYYTAVHLKREANNSPKLITNKSVEAKPPSNSESKPPEGKLSESRSISSAPRTLEDSLENSTDTLSQPRREDISKPIPPAHRHITDDKIPWNIVHPPPISPLPPDTRSVQRAVPMPCSFSCNTKPQEQDWQKPISDDHRKTCWPSTLVFGSSSNSPQKNPIEATVAFDSNHFPLVKRSESAEANAGSPPPSLGLTPDSLVPSSQLHCDGVLPSRSPDLSSRDEDRICPMCAAVFPCPVPQDQFETHVVNHFELEEFELLNI